MARGGSMVSMSVLDFLPARFGGGLSDFIRKACFCDFVGQMPPLLGACGDAAPRDWGRTQGPWTGMVLVVSPVSSGTELARVGVVLVVKLLAPVAVVVGASDSRRCEARTSAMGAVVKVCFCDCLEPNEAFGVEPRLRQAACTRRTRRADWARIGGAARVTWRWCGAR
jgi:hypothetical protein